MTNAEKYLKDGITVDDLYKDLEENSECIIGTALYDFFKKEAKQHSF